MNNVGWFSRVLKKKDVVSPDFRRVYNTCFGFLIHFKIIFQETLTRFQKFEEKYFHLGFKVFGLTHLKPTGIQRSFSYFNFQKLFYSF
jgi:hypothetical protein